MACLIVVSCLWNSMGSLCWPLTGLCPAGDRGNMGPLWLSLEINGGPEVLGPLFLLCSKKTKKEKKTSSEMKKFTWFNLHWEPVTAILRTCASLYWAADCWCLNPCVPAFLSLFPFSYTLFPLWRSVCVYVCERVCTFLSLSLNTLALVSRRVHWL